MKAAILKVATSRKFWIGFNLWAWGVHVAALSIKPEPSALYGALFHTACIASLVQIEKEEL